MKLTEAIKSYFSRYDDDDKDKTEAEKREAAKRAAAKRAAASQKKKKKKPVRAGSYFKKKREGYEKALEEAGDY